MAEPKTSAVREFGDFQTPDSLAERALSLVKSSGFRPCAIVEATCGCGAFVVAACKLFPDARILAGDVNGQHIAQLNSRLAEREPHRAGIDVRQCDFFERDWSADVARLPDPLLITGNYPWVTSSALGVLRGSNLPEKTNARHRRGLDALTGKSNFDISEWMILRNVEWLANRSGAIATLCKTAVARKILDHVWRRGLPVRRAWIHRIDAMVSFGASVDACLFFLEFTRDGNSRDCDVFASLEARVPERTIGFYDETLISCVEDYLRNRDLGGRNPGHVWRSGVKHDCARVMEITHADGRYRNGAGTTVDIEEEFLFPMRKSSDVNGRWEKDRRRYMLVTQRAIGEPTAPIAWRAPRTWNYLQDNAEALAARRSSIYRGKPDFSIFGVGDYTFAPWKVAISGFYKSLDFCVVGPAGGKPVVFDDTVYFLACGSEDEAEHLHRLLMSEPAQSLLRSMVFWGDKRPITADLLSRIDLRKVAARLGLREDHAGFVANVDAAAPLPVPQRPRRAPWQGV